MALVCFCFFRLLSDTCCHGTDKRPAERNFGLRPGPLVAKKKKKKSRMTLLSDCVGHRVCRQWLLAFASCSFSRTPNPHKGIYRVEWRSLRETVCYVRQRNQNRIFIVFFPPIESDSWVAFLFSWKKTTFIRCYWEKKERYRR